MGHLNLFGLDKLANWEFPTSGNVITGEAGRAVAILCDRCAVHAHSPSSPGTRKHSPRYAVEFTFTAAGEPLAVYHAIDQLPDVPPPQTHQIVEQGGRRGITCLVCGRTSWHPLDVVNKYCGNCHAFHPIGGAR